MEREDWKATLRKSVTLKKGGKIDVTIGLAYEAALRALLEQQPALFHDLVTIAKGQGDNVTERSVAQLKDNFLLRANGSIDPDLRNVLFSSYIPDTPDGPCIVSPFKPTREEAREVERAQDHADLNLLKLLQEEGGKGPGRI